MTQETIDEMLANIDADGDGDINYTEFINANVNKKKALTQEKLKEAFDYFDNDGSGYIT